MKQLIYPLLIIICQTSLASKLILNIDFTEGARNSRYISSLIHGANLSINRHGEENSSYSFDGIDDYLEIPSNIAPLQNHQSFSIETYVYMEPTQGTWGTNQENEYYGGALFSVYGAKSSSKDLLLLLYNEDRIGASHRTQKNSNWEKTSIIAQIPNLYNEYHHIMLIRNGKTRTMALYVDGQKIDEIDISPAGNFGNFPIQIGKHNQIQEDANGTFKEFGAYFFKGKMDYFRVHKNALSPKQVYRIYQKARQAPFKCNYCEKEDKSKGRKYDNSSEIERDLYVYPNPSRNQINIRSNSTMDCREIRIINHCGQVVLRSTFQGHINTGSLKPGYYTVVFLTPEKNYHRQLIVVR